MFELFQRGPRFAPPKRNRERREHARDGGMDSARQHRDPQQRKPEQIGEEPAHTEKVHARHGSCDAGRGADGRRVEIRRVYQRDDQDGADIVDDRDGDEQQLDGRIGAAAQQSEHADGEGDVGR
jgi:hypothetical protein